MGERTVHNVSAGADTSVPAGAVELHRDETDSAETIVKKDGNLAKSSDASPVVLSELKEPKTGLT